MPLVRIAVPKNKTPRYRETISEGVQRALVEVFDVPTDDLFQVITEHAPQTEIVHSSSYLGIAYSDELILIQITANDTRNVEQKKKLYKRIVDHLSESPGLRPEDILINLVEVKKENWSFGKGEAQYA
jgi:4-oxalocrotonate tautomerase